MIHPQCVVFPLRRQFYLLQQVHSFFLWWEQKSVEYDDDCYLTTTRTDLPGRSCIEESLYMDLDLMFRLLKTINTVSIGRERPDMYCFGVMSDA